MQITVRFGRESCLYNGIQLPILNDKFFDKIAGFELIGHSRNSPFIYKTSVHYAKKDVACQVKDSIPGK